MRFRGVRLFLSLTCLTGWLAVRAADDPLGQQAAVIQEGKTSIPQLMTRYREMMRSEPQNPLGYTLSAAAHHRKESRALYEKALAISPDYYPARAGLARYLMREDRAAEALPHFQKALLLVSSDKNLRSDAVNAAVKAKAMAEARQIAGADNELKIEIVNTLIDTKEFDTAKNELNSIPVPKSGSALAAEGRLTYLVAQAANDRSGRERGVDLLIESWRKSPELLLHYRMSYPRRSTVQTLTEARRTKELREVAEKGIALFPNEYGLYEALWKLEFATVKTDYTVERANVVRQVEELLRTRPPSPDLLKVAALGYKMAESTSQSDQMNRRLVAEYPYSMPAQMVKRTEAFFEKDLRKKLVLLDQFNRDFVTMPMYNESFATLDQLNVSNAELLKGAEAFIRSTPYSHAVIQVGEVFLRRKIYYDRLTVWLDRQMGNARPPADAWGARVAALRGKLYLAQGNIAAAERMLRPLPELEMQGYSNVDKGKAQFYLAQVLEAKKQRAEAMEMYAQSFAQSQHFIAEAGESFKRLYSQLNSGERGMQEFLETREGMYQVSSTTGIERGTKIDKPAPEFSMLGLDGNRITKASLRGKVAVVNFWATWCGPCIKELPHFQEFHEKMKGDPGVAVLAVTTDENRALVEPFIRKNRYTFNVLYDEGLKSDLGIRGIPATFVIDPEGMIRLRMIGFNANEPLVPYLTKLVQQFRTGQATPVAQSSSVAAEPSAAKRAFQSVDRMPRRALSEAEWKAAKAKAASDALGSLSGEAKGADLYYIGMLEVTAERWKPATLHLREYLALPPATEHEMRMNQLSAQTTLKDAFIKGGMIAEGEKYYASDPISLAIFVSMSGDQQRPLSIYESYLASNPPPERARTTKSLILITLGSMKRADEMAKRLEIYRADLTANSIVNNYSTLARLYAESGDEAKSNLYTNKLLDFGKQSKDGKAVDGPVNAHINWMIKRLEDAKEASKLNDFIHSVRTEFAGNKSVIANLDSREKFRAVLNQPAKELEIDHFVGGERVDLKGLRGRVVLLDFFAHWCGPCIADFPIVRDLQQRFEKRGLTVLGITSVYGYYQGQKSLTPEAEVAQMKSHFAKEYQVSWPMVFGLTEANDENYGVGYIPHLVLIDRAGIVRFAKVGRSNQQELEAQIVKLLDETAQ